ncbi:hypothetical protein DUNSADRAFT_12146 [Dunaliella salina]|uniref:Uncharacterized protein n=1 Tax=Dunaliella salina TaxID=3046 RepID=A0ABQ7GBX5_DUNSA|nr:hypothetical protein DUNSADRAFT_12146 [Dunaliella salina]|eukprot:KAF5832097.1 hypothetical protein DUNSADRAFT_12146 [Dunaliella salina]
MQKCQYFEAALLASAKQFRNKDVTQYERLALELLQMHVCPRCVLRLLRRSPNEDWNNIPDSQILVAFLAAKHQQPRSSQSGVKRGAASLVVPQGSSHCVEGDAQVEGPAAKRQALAEAPNASDQSTAGQGLASSLQPPTCEPSASGAAFGQPHTHELQGIEGSGRLHHPHPGPQEQEVQQRQQQQQQQQQGAEISKDSPGVEAPCPMCLGVLQQLAGTLQAGSRAAHESGGAEGLAPVQSQLQPQAARDNGRLEGSAPAQSQLQPVQGDQGQHAQQHEQQQEQQQCSALYDAQPLPQACPSAIAEVRLC